MPAVDVPSGPSGTDQQGENASQNPNNPNSQFRPLDRSNTFWARQTNAANWSLGRLTKEDAETMFALEEARNWGKMLKNCEKRRESLMKYSMPSPPPAPPTSLSLSLSHICLAQWWAGLTHGQDGMNWAKIVEPQVQRYDS